MGVIVALPGCATVTPCRSRTVPAPADEMLTNRELPVSATVSVPEGLTASAAGTESVIPDTGTGLAWPLPSASSTIRLLPVSAMKRLWFSSIARPPGLESGIPSPPSDRVVAEVWSGATRTTELVPASAMYRYPVPSTARPLGVDKVTPGVDRT